MENLFLEITFWIISFFEHLYVSIQNLIFNKKLNLRKKNVNQPLIATSEWEKNKNKNKCQLLSWCWHERLLLQSNCVYTTQYYLLLFTRPYEIFHYLQLDLIITLILKRSNENFVDAIKKLYVSFNGKILFLKIKVHSQESRIFFGIKVVASRMSVQSQLVFISFHLYKISIQELSAYADITLEILFIKPK